VVVSRVVVSRSEVSVKRYVPENDLADAYLRSEKR